MKVKLKSEYNSSTSPLHFVLKNRGINEEDIEKYLNPTEDLMPDWTKLDNIEKGISLLKRHVEEGSKIAVIVDSDLDGLTSASIMYKYIVNYLGHSKDNISMIQHETKAHGINLSKTLETLSNGDLLITPDAASSDFEEHKVLHNNGIDVLVIDHHLAPKEETTAIIINNQLSDSFPNKALTGSAMTYLFCLAYSQINSLRLPYDLQDLSASGMVADRADFSKDVGAYYMMRSGLKKENIKSKMLQKVIEKNNNLEDSRDLNAKDIGFNVAPIFNSVFRMGKPEELEQVIHGMCEFDYTLYNKRKKMNQHIIDEAYLRAQAVKRRQKKQEDEVMEKIIDRINTMESDKHKILIVNSTNIIEDNGLNGLVAMKLVREYKRPVLMVKVVGDELKGSARNLNNSPIESLNDFLTSTGKFDCKGHDNAFGVSFKLEDALTIQSELDELLKDVNFEDIEYEADFRWNGYVDVDTINELGNNIDLWCNGIDEPLIHIQDKVIQKKNINFIGKTGRTMKLDIQGVDCLKFNVTESQKHEIATSSDLISIDLICTASINSYMGRNTPQLMIEDFEIKNADDHVVKHLSIDSLPF
ncbi:DHH family phosphoesterase [Mammaliicoccus sciuri]|uniref:DHH family phosphoesterase n=1 Tax=Mammaliicoccus sciuri TaxID=1296 RepID=UPI002DB9EBF6|nr:DHH family phosphoesterase [Mammaliicoccus sciuri]MEB6232571.1 DHH family phosphoesterase [Mammaliicoccus sciuri]